MKELIDEKDKKILEILKENSSLSTHKISKKTLIPVTTVNNRIKKLKKLGVIKKYTVDIDYKKLEYNLRAYIFVNLTLEELKKEKITSNDLMKKIRKNPDVESVDNVTGDMDVVIKIRVKDIDDLNRYVVDELSEFPGVERTRTAIILTKD